MKKLVRDLIPEIIDRSGRKPIHYKASDEEFRELVKKKLLEEAQEFFEAENMEELADVLEVIETIYKAHQFDKDHVQKVKEKKNSERGSFNEKIVLVEIQTT